MYRILALAALASLLMTGCTSNGNDNVTGQQVNTKQNRMETKAHNVENRSQANNTAQTRSKANSTTQSQVDSHSLTQSSSVTTSDANTNTIGMQQTPAANTNWFDWLNNNLLIGRNPGNQAPGGQPTYQTPTANPAPAPAPAPADQNAGAGQTQFEQQVVEIVNKERAKAGLQPLSINNELANMAMVKAQDLHNNNYFDHNSPTYGSPFDMMRQFGITYNFAGENIAKGQTSPTQVMNDWMNSPGHKANILKNSFTQIGVAYYKGSWVQEFIG